MESAVQPGDGDFFTGVHLTVEDARDSEAPQIVAVVEVRHQNLQWSRRISLGQRDRLHDGVEQRTQILASAFDVGRSRAYLGVGVEHGEVQLIFFSVEIDEQVVDFVEHFLRAGVGAVDLINNDDGRQLGFERFAQNVAGLRQRSFARIYQQHDAVDHFQGALDFAAEIAVAGRVDDVDLYVVIEDGGVLGEDGNPALAFQFVRVHHPVDVVLVGAKCSALLQHGVNQRGLAVVNVGDDGDIANA